MKKANPRYAVISLCKDPRIFIRKINLSIKPKAANSPSSGLPPSGLISHSKLPNSQFLILNSIYFFSHCTEPI